MVLKPIALSDREWADKLLRISDFQGAEYSFINNYTWKDVFDVRVGRVDDFYIVRSGKRHPAFLFPAGRGDLKKAVLEMEENVGANQFYLDSVPKAGVLELEKAFPGKYEFTPERAYFDYIYESEKLITLSGKKLHAKRNHVNRFDSLYQWRYEDITPENIGECYEMNRLWNSENDKYTDHFLEKEHIAVDTTFRHFFELGAFGGALRVEGKIIAYSIGSRLNSSTAVIHLEKALYEYEGAYAVINQEFVRRNFSACKYINREDDSGIEGLRKAKESYHPEYLLEKFKVTIKHG